MHRDTLVEQFVRDQAKAPGATGELSTLLSRVSLAGRLIAAEIMKAGFVGRLGLTGERNIQGEAVRALDVISNQIFLEVFENIDVVHSMASEEMDKAHFYDGQRTGKYLVMFDPLDGSGNVNVDGPMGTIFGIHERKSPSDEVDLDDFLRKGSEQIAAGYVLYGPSTMFVYTAGGPVNGFTLDRSVGTFFLTHPNMKIPEGKGSYAVNESNEPRWDEATCNMVRAFRTGEVAERIGKRSARYIGALVADFHRTMIQGGIYMYPADKKATNGKLRLLYECAPLAMVARQAGGRASTGTQDVLDVQATELHQRVPLYIGSQGDVAEALRLLKA